MDWLSECWKKTLDPESWNEPEFITLIKQRASNINYKLTDDDTLKRNKREKDTHFLIKRRKINL